MRLLVVVFVLFLLPLYSSQFCLSCLFGNWQATAVIGRLLCNGEPAKDDVEVKLYDEEIFSDAELAKRGVGYSGYFRIKGKKFEVSSIEPYVSIYHKCNYAGPCYKELSFVIPSEFISIGTLPKKTYDLGTIDLAGYKDQSTVCL